ncbi:CBS domain-containing protein CBSCBSPB3 [Lactuca sativa]|uniref:CBS domain-containing protein CBSCBSPB3 n=1 Tax=Lactuca sativa TaxID=4236 RepID=UPI0022AE930E|nr:CBS domain-containing protein CBSCBSPB3 [Lactuca sativa]
MVHVDEIGFPQILLTMYLYNSQGSSVPPPPSLSDVGSSTSTNQRRQRSPTNHVGSSNARGKRKVKKLRLSKLLTMPDETPVLDVCRRMAARRVNVAIFTDANSLLCGIVTGKDIATKVVAEKLSPHQTIISKVMTKYPMFVTSDSLAMDTLQKMIQGKFRHFPVVENGEVIASLDIKKCLYDAISGIEKTVERESGNNLTAPSTFVETLSDQKFQSSLSTIITENSKVATVMASDPVYVAAKRMKELEVSSVIIMAGNIIQGILTSKDLLMRVVARNLPLELTFVEKVMTPNPKCATVDTTILEALHIMHDGKFLHLPILDKDGSVVACLDVFQITPVAISMGLFDW